MTLQIARRAKTTQTLPSASQVSTFRHVSDSQPMKTVHPATSVTVSQSTPPHFLHRFKHARTLPKPTPTHLWLVSKQDTHTCSLSSVAPVSLLPRTIHTKYHSCVSIERLSNYLCHDTDSESEALATQQGIHVRFQTRDQVYEDLQQCMVWVKR